MNCIHCGEVTPELPLTNRHFCLKHQPMPEYKQRLPLKQDAQGFASFDHAEDSLSRDRRPSVLHRVARWMSDSGYSKWAKYSLKAETISAISANVFTDDENIIVALSRPTTAFKAIAGELCKEWDTHAYKFAWNDWPRIRSVLDSSYALLQIDGCLNKWTPRSELQSSNPNTMARRKDGTFTCEVAINRGQIVGGEWIKTTTGVSEFLSFFEGACMMSQRKMGKFGRRFFAPANEKNLENLVNFACQPADIKIEAIVERLKLAKRQRAVASTFSQRMCTLPYTEGGLHRYVYNERDDPFFGLKREKYKNEELEVWDGYLNKYKPYSQQKITAQASWEAEYMSWWIDMRVGKTPTAISMINRIAREHTKYDHCVVVAPAINVYDPWFKELEGQGSLSVYVCDNGAEEDLKHIKSEAYDVYIISYTTLKERLPMMQWYWSMESIAWFFDETSAIKNPESQRSKSAVYATEHAAMVMVLNGTPLAQGPGDIWSQQMVVDQGSTFGVKFHKFAEAYLTKDSRGKVKLDADMSMSFEMKLAGSSIRYIRSEADQFSGKDKNFRYITIPPTEEMKRDTKEILEGYTRDARGNETEIKTCILTVYGHLRECCGGYRKWEVVPDSGIYERHRHAMNPKVVWIKTFLRGNPGQPMVIFSENSEVEDCIMEMLEQEEIPYSSMRQRGNSQTYKGMFRTNQIDDFQEGRTRVILMKSSQAKGVTLNRKPAVKAGLGSYPVIVYTQPTWSLIDWEQSQDRCVGTDDVSKKSISTMVYVLTVRGSIEVKIVSALRNKKKVAETLLSDAARDGYSNPFEEMDLSDESDDGDEFFDAEDMEARYALQLAPQKKLTSAMILKADAKYKAAKYGTTQAAQKGRPPSSHASYLLAKIGAGND